MRICASSSLHYRRALAGLHILIMFPLHKFVNYKDHWNNVKLTPVISLVTDNILSNEYLVY